MSTLIGKLESPSTFLLEYVPMLLSPKRHTFIASQKDTDEGWVQLSQDEIASELKKLK